MALMLCTRLVALSTVITTLFSFMNNLLVYHSICFKFAGYIDILVSFDISKSEKNILYMSLKNELLKIKLLIYVGGGRGSQYLK